MISKRGMRAGRSATWATLITTALIATTMAQEVSTPKGAPNATVVIDGKQIPAPPQPFGGVINQLAQELHSILAGPHRAA